MTSAKGRSPGKYAPPPGDDQTVSLGEKGAQARIVHNARIVHTQKLHVGPLPAASDLEAYAKIGKNGEVLDLILDMARKNNETQNRTALRAQWFSFLSDIFRTFIGLIFGAGCLFAAYRLAMHDHPYTAGIIATTTVLIGLGVLVMRVLPSRDGSPPPPQDDDQ